MEEEKAKTPLTVHLINVSQPEGEAVTAQHKMSLCMCGKPADAVFLMRHPEKKVEFGQDITGFCACVEHEEEFLREMAEISYREGYHGSEA